MTNQPKRQLDSAVQAVLHRSGSTWQCLVARSDASRNAAKPQILATRDFPDGQAGEIDAWLDENSVSQVTCVLPASSVICRTCSLPDASPDHLHAALRLQAEAHLFGIAPAHRIAMAVLESAPGETTRSGIIVAWPESAEIDLPRLTRPVRFTPDVAALAALTDGQRPNDPLMWLDRADGSVALAVSHANGVAFRSVREDVEDTQTWQDSVGRMLAETCLNANHTPEFVKSIVNSTQDRMANIAHGDGRLLIPADLVEDAAKRIGGANADQTWWSRYGVAAGALLVRSGELAPLAELEHSPPASGPSRLSDVVDVLSSPRTARILVLAAVLVLMFGPLVMNFARYTVLRLRHADIDEKLKLANQAKENLVVYRELGESAWPMAKILSDVSLNTPEGVELETIRVRPSRRVVVRGRAIPHDGMSATEVVVLMQQYLRDSNIFNEITLNWGDSDSFGHYEFELSANLIRPYRKHNYPDELDYGTWTVVDRRDGRMPGTTSDDGSDDESRDESTARVASNNQNGDSDNGSSSARPQGPDDDDRASSDSRGSRPRGSSIGGQLGGSAVTREEVRSQAGIAPHQEIPDPITQSQVNAMSLAEVDAMLTKVGYARNAARARNEEELENRLRQEFQWLLARKRDLQ